MPEALRSRLLGSLPYRQLRNTGDLEDSVNAYQNLFDVLETKETDSGVALYSRSESDKGTSNDGQQNAAVAELEAAIRAQGETASLQSVMPDSAPGRRHSSRLAQTLAEEFGVKLHWITGDTFFNGVNYKGEVFIDVDSDTPHHVVLGHELVHTLKKDHLDLYQQLADVIIPRATDTEGSAKAHHKKEGTAAANEEYVADVVGNRFGERQFWEDMAATEPKLFRKVANILKGMLANLVNKFRRDKLQYGDAVKDLNKVRATVSEVMVKFRKRQNKMAQNEFAGKYEQPICSKSNLDAPKAVLSQWQKKLKLAKGKGQEFEVWADAPLIMRELGLVKDIRLSNRRLRKIKKDHSDLPVEAITELPVLLADPTYVYSRADDQSTVVIEAVTSKGEPVLVGMEGGRITTIHPKHDSSDANGHERLMGEIAKSRLVYARNEKALAEAKANSARKGSGQDAKHRRSNGYNSQSPTRSKNIITKADIVKKHGREDESDPLFLRRQRDDAPIQTIHSNLRDRMDGFRFYV